MYNNEHMVLQWGGYFRSNGVGTPIIEEFTGSLRFSGPGVAAVENDQTMGSMALVLQRFWTAGGAQIPKNAWLEYLKWNRVDREGHYLSGNTRKMEIKGVGGGGTGMYPTQVSWATTWTTDVERGKASRGRTFWPTAAPLNTVSMRTTTETANTMARLAAKLIRDLNYASLTGSVEDPPAGAPDWLVAIGWNSQETRDGTGPVASIMSKIGNGTTRSIGGAKQGTRLDIQRRRGENMFEEYSGASITPS